MIQNFGSVDHVLDQMFCTSGDRSAFQFWTWHFFGLLNVEHQWGGECGSPIREVAECSGQGSQYVSQSDLSETSDLFNSACSNGRSCCIKEMSNLSVR